MIREQKTYTLREYRTDRGIHINTLSQFVGLKPRTVYEWETGKHCPRTRHLKKLADFYSLTIDELMEVLSETLMVRTQREM